MAFRLHEFWDSRGIASGGCCAPGQAAGWQARQLPAPMHLGAAAVVCDAAVADTAGVCS